jgi:hypothetical protein
MLATPARTPPIGEGWVLELKWDGCRAQLIVDRGAWTVRSRTGRSMTGLGELSVLVAALSGRRVIIDGELVCLGADGKADFHALRPRINGAAGVPATFIAFDVLYLDGFAIRELPYGQRRELLSGLLPASGPAGLSQGRWMVTPAMSSGCLSASAWKASSPNVWTGPIRPADAQRTGPSSSCAAARPFSSQAGHPPTLASLRRSISRAAAVTDSGGPSAACTWVCAAISAPRCTPRSPSACDRHVGASSPLTPASASPSTSTAPRTGRCVTPSSATSQSQHRALSASLPRHQPRTPLVPGELSSRWLAAHARGAPSFCARRFCRMA